MDPSPFSVAAPQSQVLNPRYLYERHFTGDASYARTWDLGTWARARRRTHPSPSPSSLQVHQQRCLLLSRWSSARRPGAPPCNDGSGAGTAPLEWLRCGGASPHDLTGLLMPASSSPDASPSSLLPRATSPRSCVRQGQGRLMRMYVSSVTCHRIQLILPGQLSSDLQYFGVRLFSEAIFVFFLCS